MKKNYVKMFIALIVVATFSIYQVQSQNVTSGSGVLTNNGGCTAAGTGGDCTDTYIGRAAGASTTATNSYNSFFGDHAGFSNVSGTNNTHLGWEAGYDNTASNNTFIGSSAGWSNTGTYNVIVGQAGYYNTSGGKNSFLGYQAGQQNTTASSNSALGFNSLYYNQTGQYNTCLGAYAGEGSTGNSYSNGCFVGYQAGYSNKLDDNTALGYQALYSNKDIECTAIGSGALYNSNAEGNTATGYYALNAVTTTGYSTANGYNALYQSTGAGNTAVGANALANNTTGANNTAIGKSADIPSGTTYSNCTYLGYNGGTPWIAASNQMQLGNSSVSDIWCSNATIHSASDRRIKNNIKENVPGLAFINLLKPVTYHYDIHKENSILGYPTKTTIIPGAPIATTTTDSLGQQVVSYSPGTPTTVTAIDTSYWAGKYDVEKINYTGLIAQQVDSAAQKIGYDFNGVYRPIDANHLYALSYTQFIMPLIKAVQELSKEVDSLKSAAKPTGTLQHTRNNSNEPDDATSIHNIELANNAILYQNAPNPFGNGTTIKYFVPENADAQIIFYDEFGTQIKTFKVSENGTGQLNIDASNLAAGMYSYSLIVNGKVVDTKKMLKSN